MFISLETRHLAWGSNYYYLFFYFFVGLASFLSTHNTNLKKKRTPTSLIVLANPAGLLGVYVLVCLCVTTRNGMEARIR